MSELWSVERERELTQLWEEGLSGAQIARRMGGFGHAKDGGRSAVLGKVHRMGLPARNGVQTPEEQEEKKRARLEARRRRDRTKSDRISHDRKQKRIASVVAELVAIESNFEERSRSSLQFNDLRMFSPRTSNQCRFPINDAAPFWVCGAVTPPGESWCPHCRDIVMAKPGPVLSDEERFRRAMAFKKNALSRSVTNMPTARDQAA